MPPLTGYIQKALAQARFKKMDDGMYFGEIPACRGVWAQGRTQSACKKELQEVLEDWLLLKLRDGDEIPSVGDYQLKLAV